MAQTQSLKHIFKTQKVFVKDLDDKSREYFYTTKVFLGKLDNFDSKNDKAFEDRHLKSYLKGNERFQYKKSWFDVQKGVRIHKLDAAKVDSYIANSHKPINVNIS